MRRVNVLTQRGRWLSTSSSDGWSRYALVGIPLAILGVVVTDIVCNINHRKALEKRLPIFVRLVREHYGFDDEDPQELARVKMVKQENMKPVDVTIHLRDGTLVQLRGVDGAKSVQELVKEAAQQPGDGNDWSQLDLLAGVEFTPTTVENSSDIPSDNRRDTENGVPIAAEQKPTARDANSTAVSLDQGTWGMLRSFWESLPDNSDSPNPTRSSSFGAAVAAAARSGERTPAQALLRFENACADLGEGLRSYTAYGTLLPVFADGSSQEQARQRSRGGFQAVGAAQQRPRPQQQKPASEADMAKARARKRVEDLERAIALLREEQRRGSSREVDAVEAEIRAKQQEIAELRRKHLNYFYYF